jgi:hypothetical protein
MQDMREADIVISGDRLSGGQSLAVRVAVESFLMTLSDPDFRAGLGEPLATNYVDRLIEVRTLIGRTAR